MMTIDRERIDAHLKTVLDPARYEPLLDRFTLLIDRRNQLKPSTRRAYMLRYQYFRQHARRPDPAGVAKNTYYHDRAAWIYGWMEDGIEALDAMAALSLSDRDGILHCWAKLEEAVVELDRLRPDPDRLNKDMPQYIGEYRRVHGANKVGGRRSKRVGIGGLPIGWPEVFVSHMFRRRSPHAMAALVCALSGARPAELLHGVTVWINRTRVGLLIEGAKFKDGLQGQAWRWMVFEVATSPLAKLLWCKMAERGRNRDTVKIESTGAFRQSIAHFSKQLMPRLAAQAGRRTIKYEITPYSFRHQLASDLKADRFSNDQIAIVLGHATDESCTMYGTAVTGHKGRSPIRYRASAEVKLKARNPSRLRKQLRALAPGA